MINSLQAANTGPERRRKKSEFQDQRQQQMLSGQQLEEKLKLAKTDEADEHFSCKATSRISSEIEPGASEEVSLCLSAHTERELGFILHTAARVTAASHVQPHRHIHCVELWKDLAGGGEGKVHVHLISAPFTAAESERTICAGAFRPNKHFTHRH
ncbi:uncharacterized protein V6R79_021060 [Siganus canaliculatus]